MSKRGSQQLQKSPPGSSVPVERGSYLPPALERWGSIRELTRGGQAVLPDGASGNSRGLT